MKLDKLVKIDGWFSRSINVERDGSSLDAVNAYVLTSTALKTLKNIANGFSPSKFDRAWSFIGPYGSGKSSFAIFLNALLQDKETALFKTAASKLRPLDPALTDQFAAIATQGGALTIMVTGSYASLERALFKSILHSIDQVKFKKSDQSAINACIQSATQSPSSETVVNLLKLIQEGLESNNGLVAGIVIVIDELGKFAEYAAKNKGESDISILQVLSEWGQRNTLVPMFLIGMQHQSLEYYAKELDIETKAEWKKIKGRFTETPFLESVEQTIRIISKAIIPNFSNAQSVNIKKALKAAAQGIVDNKIFPDISKIRDAVDFFSSAYPLHPITAILLPALAQKLGQNERTVFTYLGSSEQFGFQDQLRELDYPSLIMPSVMFDYFVTNQASSVYDHFTHKQWVEVGEAINRLGDSEETTVNILKTIGLLNLVGSTTQNLRASNEILETIYSKAELAKALEVLQKKSIITYRRFNNEYRVWQGSDFDFEKSLSHEIAQFESFDLANELNALMPPLPLIAKRYSVISGTLRILPSSYLAEDQLPVRAENLSHSVPQAILLLKDKPNIQSSTLNILKSLPDHIIVLDVSSDLGLENQAKELKALRIIDSTYDTIQSDPIAKKELSDQIGHRQSTLTMTLKRLTDPLLSSWYWQGQKLKIKTNLDAQAKLSEILESVYSESPVIRNELVNKDQVSAQGQSARTKLMKDMLHNLSELNLGYEADKFPAEKTVFNAVFVANNLYTYEGDEGKFIEPLKGTNLFSVYQFLKERLLQTDEPVPFSEIQEALSAIPYGLKRGLQPLIFMGFYFANEATLAVYEDGIFQPYINNEHIDRLVAKTQSFAFQMHAFEGQQAIISQYAQTLFQEKDSKEINILNLVKTLSTVMKELPDYVFNTRANLSKEAIKFRSSYNLAKSPQDLLLKDIPIALGYKPEDLSKKSKIEAFSNDLNATLTELKQSYGNLLLNQIVKFNLAFEFNPKNNLREMRTKLRTKYLSLGDYSVDSLTLKPFLAKILEQGNDDRIWFEGLLSFLVKRDPTKWHDETISEAEVELRNISDRMKDISKLQVFEANNNTISTKDIDVYVMRLKKKGFDEQDFITMFSKNDQVKYEDFKIKMLKTLHEFSSNTEDHLTYLAPLLDEMLNNKIEMKNKLKIVKGPKD